MVVFLYLDTLAHADELLPWALRIGAARERELVLYAPLPHGSGDTIRKIDPASTAGEDPAGARFAVEARRALDAIFGQHGWTLEKPGPPAREKGKLTPNPDGPGPSANDAEALPPVCVAFKQLASKDPVALFLREVDEHKPTELIGIQPRFEGPEADSSKRRRRILAATTCMTVFVRPGKRPPDQGGVLVPVERGHHSRAALQVAHDLLEAGHTPATALFVEPELGPDAELVGTQVLKHILDKALGAKGADLRRHVVIDDVVHHGILHHDAELQPSLIVMGFSRAGGFGQRRRRTTTDKVIRGADTCTFAVVRAAMPLKSRLKRELEELLQQRVPQLQRDQRIDLAERVQSSSDWDFDFMALMALSALIAAAGLVANSGAVIIGAMLVAPLMTPLLGVGLAMVQGNPRMARMSQRSILLGFLLCFGLSVVVGMLQPEFGTPTPEMLERDWPQLLDLFVAFVAGLAGAYTYSRPSLISALPGVAIAAALVPPIATAGLATSMMDWDLAVGAALLFGVNLVAIIVASAMTLWAVGLRYTTQGSKWTRLTGLAAVLVTLGFGVTLRVLKPHYAGVPIVRTLESEFDGLLGEGFTIQEAELVRLRPRPHVRCVIGGPRPVSSEVVESLRKRLAIRFEPEIVLTVESRIVVEAHPPDERR